MSYPGHSFGVGVAYPSAEKQSVYSTAPADWANWMGKDDLGIVQVWSYYMCKSESVPEDEA